MHLIRDKKEVSIPSLVLISKESEQRDLYVNVSKSHLLWGNLIGSCSHVNLLINIKARDDKEDSRTAGSSCNQSSKSEDDSSLIFLEICVYEKE